MTTNMATSQNWKKKKKTLGHLSMDFGCKIDKLFQQMILHATSVLGAWLFWQVDLWVFLFPSGSWWRSDGWIFLLSTSTNLDFLELSRCCVFRQWKDLDHFIWFRSFRRWFCMIFSFPPPPSPPPKKKKNISLCANLTHPKKRKKKEKKGEI